jgi:DNA-binding NarL/FixJ family response regulator
MTTDYERISDEPIRIMLVDDHSIVRKGLALILEAESDMTVVGQAENGTEAVDRFRALRPDVTLMDLKMNGMSGVDTVSAVRNDFPNARMIMLSTYDRDDDIYRSIRAGAMGYLVKDTPSNEILDAIRNVYAGRKYFPPLVSEKLAERLTMPELSERETEVLQLMTAGQSNKEIANSLSLAIGTVKCHVNSILAKLGADDRTQAVVTALKKGLTDLDVALPAGRE